MFPGRVGVRMQREEILPEVLMPRSLRLPLLLTLLCLTVGCGNVAGPPPKEADQSTAWFQDTVLDSDKLVVADFSATWCGPCRHLAPLLHKLEREHGDQLKVVAIDIDEHPSLQARYRVNGIPHILLFSDGEILLNPGPGAPRSYEELEELIKPWLSAGQKSAALSQ